VAMGIHSDGGCEPLTSSAVTTVPSTSRRKLTP
jgi:hypothetical protein